MLTSLVSPDPEWKDTQLTAPLDSSGKEETGISSEWLLLAALQLVFLKVDSAFHQPWEVLFKQRFLWPNTFEGLFHLISHMPQISQNLGRANRFESDKPISTAKVLRSPAGYRELLNRISQTT